MAATGSLTAIRMCWNGLLVGRLGAASALSFIPVRGKKKEAKSPKKRKDIEREKMKDFLKQQEMQQLMEGAALRAAKGGGVLDPEMLNPIRKRPKVEISDQEREARFLLVKEWTRYKMARHIEELKLLHNMRKSQVKALRELRKVSVSLHDRALQLNPNLFPFERSGPTRTPPVVGYVPPDPADG